MTTPTKTTKRGAASLFVVIITIILLGVITLGFTRLILSEVSQTSNNDLSQSAYDSALAGIEDAKIALLRYHTCLSSGKVGKDSSTPGTCEALIYAMQRDIATNNCDTVSNALGRAQQEVEGDTGGEVIVQETQDSSDRGNAEYMSQAYTCVTIKEDLDDYRTTLNSTNRLRIVPIRTANINAVASIDVEWYSETNHINNGGTNSDQFKNSLNIYKDKLPPSSDSTKKTAPLISVKMIQTDKTFKLSELDASRSDNNTDIATLYLRPSASGSESISSAAVSQTSNKSVQNNPFDVHCEVRSPFYCKTNVVLPNTYKGGERNNGTSFLILELPYGGSDTDISITLKDKDDNTLSFTGVQAKVDSTGRANDLYRRVESRIELSDTYFPYPEFAIQMTGSGNESDVEKLIWVTDNCWRSESGNVKNCGADGQNNGKATAGL